jgi:hypothetical protein
MLVWNLKRMALQCGTALSVCLPTVAPSSDLGQALLGDDQPFSCMLLMICS